MTEELKACPMCGHSTAPKMTDSREFLYDLDEDFDESNAVCHAVVCSAAQPNGPGGCGCMGGFAETEADAIAAWNRRPAPDAGVLTDAPVAWRYQTPTGWHATTDAAKALRGMAHCPTEPLYARALPPMPAAACHHRPACDECAKYGAPVAVDADKVDAELAIDNVLCTVLPGVYYMDPPDGGNVTPLEQVQRMAEDAARYRWLRDQHEASDAAETFCVFEPDWAAKCLQPVGSMPGELDAAIDQARAGGANG